MYVLTHKTTNMPLRRERRQNKHLVSLRMCAASHAIFLGKSRDAVKGEGARRGISTGAEKLLLAVGKAIVAQVLVVAQPLEGS